VGELRIYLGAAPGVGKTYAMLNEGRRRQARGTDVVAAFVETYGRENTAAELGDIEVIPRLRREYKGAVFEEMNLDAVLERRPEVALVDELAHTNLPGSRNEKRWQDVEELLEAGITVITTLNIEHLESLNDVVERITGIRQPDTIPDAVVRRAHQVELVDMTPEALRRRLAHGNVYPPEKIDAALANYFRPGNLTALRELALLWVADHVDVALEQYRDRHGITEPWEARERIVVAVSGAPGTGLLIRRAARIARRAHADLLGVHVRREDESDEVSPALEEHRRLLEEMGGQFHEVAGGDVAAALVGFSRAENATQLLLGASRQSPCRDRSTSTSSRRRCLPVGSDPSARRRPVAAGCRRCRPGAGRSGGWPPGPAFPPSPCSSPTCATPWASRPRSSCSWRWWSRPPPSEGAARRSSPPSAGSWPATGISRRRTTGGTSPKARTHWPWRSSSEWPHW
jgi:two-component system, OmpR family, sensor histidine kinase KdpD